MSGNRPPADQTAYWDRVAATKTFSHTCDPELLECWFPRDWGLLDLGCGYGRLAAELTAAGYPHVIGADRSAAMIERGRAEHPELELIALESGPLPFADGEFDGALLFSVLTCLPGQDDQAALLDELFRVVRPGGLLYTSDLMLQSDSRNRERYAEGRKRYEEEGVFDHAEGVTFSHLTPSRVAQIDARFERLAWVELDLVTMNRNAARAFQHVGRRRA